MKDDEIQAMFDTLTPEQQNITIDAITSITALLQKVPRHARELVLVRAVITHDLLAAKEQQLERELVRAVAMLRIAADFASAPCRGDAGGPMR